MPTLTPLFRSVRPKLSISLLAALAVIGFAAAPAAAEEAAVPAAPIANDREELALGAEQPTQYLQDVSDIDDDILLPAARDDDDDPERKWSRNYISVAA